MPPPDDWMSGVTVTDQRHFYLLVEQVDLKVLSSIKWEDREMRVDRQKKAGYFSGPIIIMGGRERQRERDLQQNKGWGCWQTRNENVKSYASVYLFI